MKRAEGVGKSLLNTEMRVIENTTAIDNQYLEARLAELRNLSSNVIELFQKQTFHPDRIKSSAEVCAAFAEILERYWPLCSISIFLRNDDGGLHESASYLTEEVDRAGARETAACVAALASRGDDVIETWQCEKTGHSSSRLRALKTEMQRFRFGGCIGVPIKEQDILVGVLVVLTTSTVPPKCGSDAVRFIASPVAIAVGNVKRADDMEEQHRRIEQLVEEQKQHGQALEDANRELRRVAQYRSMFLARMSHELRTPLTSVLGFAEILLDHEELSEDQRRFCGKIQSSGLQLQVSLNHLVDLSRLETGQSELFLHEFSFKEAIRESCAAVARLAEKRGVTVQCELADIPSVVSDEGKLRQVMYNFLAYAIARSPEENGEVFVRAGIADSKHFFVEISDRGKIVEETTKLFEHTEYESSEDKSATMNEIGLVIARRLIDVLDGTLSLKSVEPVGLTVRILFPIRPGK